MDRLSRLFVVGLFLLGGTACSKAPKPGQTAAQPAAEPAHVEPPPPGMPDKDATPDKTVAVFLKAAQTGNKPLLAALLSTIARAETAKNNITFQLDSYQNSKFEVGKYEFVTPQKDGAHVACVWIDRDEQGNEYKHDVIWVLRKEEAGWRIVGMITRPFLDKDPIVFNYEDIPSLVAAKSYIEAESNRREAEAQRQATEKKLGSEQTTAKPLTASTTTTSKGDASAGPAPKAGPLANQASPASSGIEHEAMKQQPANSTVPK